MSGMTQLNEYYYTSISKKYSELFSDIDPELIFKYLDFGAPTQPAEGLTYYPFIGTQLGLDFKKYFKYADKLETIHNELRTKYRNITKEAYLASIQRSELMDWMIMAHAAGVGTSFGINKYFDSGIHRWQAKKTANHKFDSMLLIIAHDWFPLVREMRRTIKSVETSWLEFFEPPSSQYGIFSNDQRDIDESSYKQSVAHIDERMTLVGVINLIPGYRKEFSNTSGKIPKAPYEAKAALVAKITQYLEGKFNKFRVVLWGDIVEAYLREHLQSIPNLKVQKLYHPGPYKNTMMQSAIDYAYFTAEFRKESAETAKNRREQ